MLIARHNKVPSIHAILKTKKKKKESNHAQNAMLAADPFKPEKKRPASHLLVPHRVEQICLFTFAGLICLLFHDTFNYQLHVKYDTIT